MLGLLITVAHMPIWSPLTRSKPLPAPLKPAEDVATANDDADLHTHLVDFLDLCSIFVETLRVDAVTLLPHKAFATEFKQDAIEFHIIEK